MSSIMKNKTLPVIFAGLLFALILVSACTETSQPPLSPVPGQTTGVPEVTVTPGTSPEITPRYHTGDIVDGTQNIDRTPHLIILNYNKTSGEYDYDIIFRNANKSWGYRIYPEHRYMPVATFEKNASYLLTHINLTDLATWFPSKEIFEKTR
jgi:hypothetical protein